MSVVMRRNVLWSLLSEAARVLITLASFILLARVLQVNNYGQYAGALAFVSIFMPFATFGASFRLVSEMTRVGATFKTLWSESVTTTVLGMVLWFALMAAVAGIALPTVDTGLVLMLGASEIVGSSSVITCAAAFQAVNRIGWSGLVRTGLALSRLAAIVIFAALPGPHTAIAYVHLYVICTLASLVLSLTLVTVVLGLPGRPRLPSTRSVLSGSLFAFNESAAYVQDDADKTLVLRLAGGTVAGYYTAAYRIVSLALVPIQAVLIATYSAFFREGAAGLKASLAFTRKLLPPAVGYSLAAGVGLILFAPLVPHILGASYKDGVLVTQVLAPLPLLRALKYLFGDALSGAGHQGARAVAQATGAVLNVGLNVALIPRFSWQGAVFSTLLCEALLVLVLWVLVRLRLKSSERTLMSSSGLVGDTLHLHE
jgi:O-antigen/teichoic acid export membrane protein